MELSVKKGREKIKQKKKLSAIYDWLKNNSYKGKEKRKYGYEEITIWI